MAFMGVRISWLTLARNSLLARLAASATSLAFSSSSFWRRILLRERLQPAQHCAQLAVLAFDRSQVVEGGQGAAAGAIVADDGRGVDRQVRSPSAGLPGPRIAPSLGVPFAHGPHPGIVLEAVRGRTRPGQFAALAALQLRRPSGRRVGQRRRWPGRCAAPCPGRVRPRRRCSGCREPDPG